MKLSIRDGLMFVLGVVATIIYGLASNSIFHVIMQSEADKEYLRNASTEIATRLIDAHQSGLMSHDSRNAFDVVKEAFEKKESASHKAEFEGQRLDNLLYEASIRTDNRDLVKLLDAIKYLTNDIPMFYKSEKDLGLAEVNKKYSQSRSTLYRKMYDYHCCLAIEAGVAEEGGEFFQCTLKDSFDGWRYCLHDGSKLIMPPGRMDRPISYLKSLKLNE